MKTTLKPYQKRTSARKITKLPNNAWQRIRKSCIAARHFCLSEGERRKYKELTPRESDITPVS